MGNEEEREEDSLHHQAPSSAPRRPFRIQPIRGGELVRTLLTRPVALVEPASTSPPSTSNHRPPLLYLPSSSPPPPLSNLPTPLYCHPPLYIFFSAIFTFAFLHHSILYLYSSVHAPPSLPLQSTHYSLLHPSLSLPTLLHSSSSIFIPPATIIFSTPFLHPSSTSSPFFHPSSSHLSIVLSNLLSSIYLGIQC